MDKDQTAALQRDRFHVAGMGNTTLYVIGAIITGMVTIFGVIIVAIVKPNDAAAIATIVGITAPITMALLAGIMQGIQRGVNGRLSQLLQVTNDQSERRGRADVLARMYERLALCEKGSKEYDALEQQIRHEVMAHFDLVAQEPPASGTYTTRR
jgi:hypothetical protein